PRLVSFYHWKGKLCRDRESLLVIKTTSAKVKKLERLLHQIHPYDLPEFVVLSMRGGSQRYLDWIRKSVKSTSKNCPSALLPSRQRSSRTSQVRSGLWLAGA
ncbi:MAG: divalent-cation tolerance protein CutA, partial [Deltaproteobacteria bacterium]|nr:divalent-cation tolerance protein CutA [Deltaproteobacteria bacterium]